MSQKPSNFPKTLKIFLKNQQNLPKTTTFLNLGLKNFEGFSKTYKKIAKKNTDGGDTLFGLLTVGPEAGCIPMQSHAGRPPL